MAKRILGYKEQYDFNELNHLAKSCGYFLIVTGRAFLLYRKAVPKNVYVASRSRLKDMRTLLNKVIK